VAASGFRLAASLQLLAPTATIISLIYSGTPISGAHYNPAVTLLYVPSAFA
jgi:glycerol uptake facilitator-like aquaporin